MRTIAKEQVEGTEKTAPQDGAIYDYQGRENTWQLARRREETKISSTPRSLEFIYDIIPRRPQPMGDESARAHGSSVLFIVGGALSTCRPLHPLCNFPTLDLLSLRIN